MKIIVNTVPEAEISQTFPRLFSRDSNAQIAVFGAETVGTWLTGDFAGLPVSIEFNVYNNANWNLLPIGYSVTLIQE
jgi:hypothetical protein